MMVSQFAAGRFYLWHLRASGALRKFNINKARLRVFLAESKKRISKTGREPALVPLRLVAKKRNNLVAFLVQDAN